MTTEGRCPIQPWEREHLEALASALKAARLQAGLSVRDLAERCSLSQRHLHRLERGERRTRASTLQGIAKALNPGDHDQLVARWLEIGGPGIAPESNFAERIQRRRERREVKRRKLHLGGT